MVKCIKRRPILENKEYRKVLQNTISNIQKNNINLDDISKISELNNSEIFAELRSVVDTLIDGDTKRLGEEINREERTDDVWIFDSRMAFDNIPGAFSVRLTVNPYEAYEYESMFESLLRRYKGNMNLEFHYSDIYPNILEKAYNDKDWYK